MGEYKFTEGALESLGFEKISQDRINYWEYVFDKDNYLDSPFLATEDLGDADTQVFRVINAGGTDIGEPYMNFTEVVEAIANGKI